MAASSDVIKEFLVALGFKIDASGLHQFNNSIASATANVAKLGTALVASGIAVEAMLAKLSSNYERFYFMAERTGGTVGNLQALEYAAGRIGLTAAQASGAVEGFARALRSQPGLMGVLQQFGIQGGSSQDMMHGLVGKLRQLPFYLASQYAGMFGIDPDTLLMLEKGYKELGEAQADYAKRQKEAGIDSEDLGKKSHEFMNALRLLESDLDILGQRLEKDLIEPATVVVHWVDEMVQAFNRLDKATHGVAGTIGAVIGTAGGALVLKSLAGRILGGGAAAAAGAVAAETGAVGAVAAGGAAVAGVGLAPAILAALGASAVVGGGIYLIDKYAGGGSSPAKTPSPGAHFALGEKQHNPGNLRSWGGTRSANGYAAFDSDEKGLSALAQQLMLYGDRGLDTISAIVDRYAPAGDHNDTGAYKRDLSGRTGFDIFQHLNTRDPDTLQKLMGGLITHEQGRDIYGPDMERQAIASRLGGVVFNQKTEINISGTGSPGVVARAVAGEQGRVNGDIVRNLESNVR